MIEIFYNSIFVAVVLWWNRIIKCTVEFVKKATNSLSLKLITIVCVTVHLDR